MKIRSFRRYFREAFLGLIRNGMMSLASIITVFSCVFIVTVFMALVINIDGMLKYLEDSVGISVILEDSIDSARTDSLFQKISSIPHVARVLFISPEDAREEFRAGIEDDKYILEGVDVSIFPSSFNLEIDDSRYQPDIIRQLEAIQNEGIDYISHAQDIVDVLLTISNIVRVVCGFLIMLLSIISVIIIMNTIKITVNTRKIEINIMKFIGATDWFIRWPFIIEGFLVGLIGSTLPIFLCWFSYDRVTQIFYENFALLNGLVIFKSSFEVFTFIIPIALLFGILIGIIGSVSAIRKHLSV